MTEQRERDEDNGFGLMPTKVGGSRESVGVEEGRGGK